MKDKTKSLTYSGRSTSNKEAGKLKSVRIKYLALGEEHSRQETDSTMEEKSWKVGSKGCKGVH